ncbi:MAG: ABC transporter ATP-binding protein [Acidimicrobiales bacterium]
MTGNSSSTTGTEATEASVPAVELLGITKRFGAVVACDDVDLALKRSRIHGILGENGAGKSTLMKILIGLVLPDSGQIRVDGKESVIQDPLDASSLGIAMVHQHFSLVEALTVWENVALGEAGRLDPAAVRNRIGDISDEYGLAIEPDARVGDLTAGLRQRVEIIKCLRRNPNIVVFDEPTSVLTPDESEQLFISLRHVVAAEGRAVVLVSHKLDEILASTDEVTIMRRGAVVDRMDTNETDARTLARGMVGRDVSLRSERAAFGLLSDVATNGGSEAEPVAETESASELESESETEAGTEAGVSTAPVLRSEPVLRIDDVTARGPGGVTLLDGLSLQVGAGEIVGIAGVEGNGQRTLGDLLSSLVGLESGSVQVNDTVVKTGRSGAMAAAGISVIPEDRHDSGVVLDMTVAENLVLVNPERFAKNGVLDSKRLQAFAEEMIEKFDIACAGPDAPLWSLSGGNQQRVVLARELSHSPAVLVAAQPTRGLDVGAIEYMTDQLRRAAADGVAVLLISSELEEVMDLAHRIVVMHAGRSVGEMSRAEADLDRIGMLMGGATS